MTRGKRTTALALAGAVALASGAYALGSQAGDGSAAAAKNSAGAAGYGPRGAHWRGGPGARFDGLADRLGVSASALRSALEDIAKAHRDDIAQKLADALGIDRAKVDAAFDKLRPVRPGLRPPGGRRGPNARIGALADALGVTRAQLRAAFQKLRADLDNERDAFATELAQRLKIDPAKVKDALGDLPFGRHRP